MRPVVSALLFAAVGFFAVGISAGLATFFCYFIGSWVGAPLGAALGAWYGARTPLRDAVIFFVTYSVIFAAGCWHCSHLSLSRPENWPFLLIWGIIWGPMGFFLPRLPLFLLSFDQRRPVALVLAVIWTVVSLIALYWRLCVPNN